MIRHMLLVSGCAVTVLLLAGCGASSTGGDSDAGKRKMTGTWKVRIDPDRTVELNLKGSFDVFEDKAEAKAGETDIKVRTFGTITVKNVSDGRNVDGIKTGLELFVPIDACPDWSGNIDGETGEYCSRDIVSFKIPDLDVDESAEVDLSGEERVTSVKTSQAKAVIDSMLGKEAVVVSADRVFWNRYLEKLNPTCEFGDDGKWVTYFTEDDDVTACATEPGGT